MGPAVKYLIFHFTYVMMILHDFVLSNTAYVTCVNYWFNAIANSAPF